MIRYENECVGCPQGCTHCQLERVICYYCDDCGEQASELFEYDGKELCFICLLDKVPKVNSYDVCEYCGEEAKEIYDYEGEKLCKSCLLETVPKVEV